MELEVTKALISIVDDDESIRRTTTFLIESFGFRAAAFESAEDFLKSFRLHETSCLIVDVQMPGMSGLQLQSQLAAEGIGIPDHFCHRVRRQGFASPGKASRCGRIPRKTI